MSNIVTVTKERLARCDFSISLIKKGKQVYHIEISGDSGEAAAQAIRMASMHQPCKIIASDQVMLKIPSCFI